MNELIKKEQIEAIKAEVAKMAEHTSKVAIGPDSLKECEGVRRDNNKFIKDVKANIETAKETLIEQVLGDQIRAAMEVLKPLEDANAEFSKKVLACKKQEYKDKAQQTFDTLNDGGISGEIYDWEKFYEDKWYGMTKDELLKHIVWKLKELRAKEDKETKRYLITASEPQFGRLDEYLKAGNYDWEAM